MDIDIKELTLTLEQVDFLVLVFTQELSPNWVRDEELGVLYVEDKDLGIQVLENPGENSVRITTW